MSSSGLNDFTKEVLGLKGLIRMAVIPDSVKNLYVIPDLVFELLERTIEIKVTKRGSHVYHLETTGISVLDLMEIFPKPFSKDIPSDLGETSSIDFYDGSIDNKKQFDWRGEHVKIYWTQETGFYRLM